MESDQEKKSTSCMDIAMLIYLGIGAVSVGWVLVWPVVTAVALFIVANKIPLSIAVITTVVKAKLKGKTSKEMIKEGLLAGGEAAAVEKLVHFLKA